MAFDGDILQIKTFSASDIDGSGGAIERVDRQVNSYLENYPADLVASINPQITNVGDSKVWVRYTVTVVLKS